MRLRIRHRTSYLYERPVRLGPHRIRLSPRSDGGITLDHHHLVVDPLPQARWQGLDPDGNLVTELRFSGETRHLHIESELDLRTTSSPAAAVGFPALLPAAEPYDPPLRQRLVPWLADAAVAPSVQELAVGLGSGSADGLAFLDALNRHLHQRLEREIREEGEAQRPEETLRRGSGACRDLTMLFLAVCRCHGWAGRFVSGYQAHGRPGARRRYLHAWPEVYLPEAGWRGFDPTHGTPVGETHVALAAAARPADAAPVEGSYRGEGPSRLETHLTIDTGDPGG
jgi:transglutaminase-like putative cysteine protease